MHRLLIICCLALLGLPGVAAASAGQTVSFEGPRDFIDVDEPRRQAALDEIQGMGVKAIRVILYWKDVAPGPKRATRPNITETDPAAYNWAKYDPVIDAANARGMKVLLTVSGPVPRWATLSRRNQLRNPSPERYARFMQAVGRHYAGRIDVYSIWNEPNHPQFLRPQFFRGKPAAGIWYRRLFLAGQRGLERAGEGDVTLLMGETAPTGTSNGVAPIVFLKTALCIDSRSLRNNTRCKKLDVDGYAHHPHVRYDGPFTVPTGDNDVMMGNLGRLSRALDRAAKRNKIRRFLPLYLTEFGVQSLPDPIFGVSQRRQAEYQAISERLAWENPRVKWFSQYLLRDSDPAPNARKLPVQDRYPGFESGLRRHNGKPKLLLKSFPVPLSAQRSGRNVSLWGYARGATGRTRVAIYVRGKRYKTIRTDSRGYFRKLVPYVAGRSYRLKWAGHFGPSIRVYPKP